ALREGDRHAQRRGDRGRGVAGAEGVVFALVAGEKAREATFLTDRREAVPPAGEELVGVGLVSDVPDDAVARRREDPVQRDCQLDGAQRRAEVPTTAGDDVNE